MKKIFLFLILPLASFADPNWPVYLHPEEECEEVVAYLDDQVSTVIFNLSSIEEQANYLDSSYIDVSRLLQDTSDYQDSDVLQSTFYYYNQQFYDNLSYYRQLSKDGYSAATNLQYAISQINCTTCIEDTPDVPGNTNGVNNCCDFTGLYQRLDTLIRLQTSIENHVSQLSTILSTVQQIKNTLSNISTNLFNNYLGIMTYSNESLQRIAYINSSSTFRNPSSIRNVVIGYNGLANFRPYYDPITYGYIPAIYTGTRLNSILFSSINNLLYDQNYFHLPPITNSLLYVSGSLAAPSPLLYFDSDVEERDYYSYLTNYYFAMLRGDEEIEESHKTNWFTRVETLLAALVFADGSKTNYTADAEESITNSIQESSDRASDFFESVAESPMAQIELVGDIEQSMYQSLRQFSAAFSSATMPQSVQVMRVEKNSGSKSVTDVVDVTVDVDGRLSDLVELLRSATTLCWVFVGLWMMFKFSVWTVKKIYLLTRYAIDFSNMILGGK